LRQHAQARFLVPPHTVQGHAARDQEFQEIDQVRVAHYIPPMDGIDQGGFVALASLVVDVCAVFEQRDKLPRITAGQAEGNHRVLSSESRALLMNARAMFEEQVHQINTCFRAFDRVHECRVTAVIARVDVNPLTGRSVTQKLAHALEIPSPDQMMKFERRRHRRR
jgi:hypothetical protein